ncbi:MAG: GNAT family N-acetyltransferase [Pseudanabaenaceae cyanobacterium SKYGB_i_bin29]|nr:GNAT family N-acetyltransferase [Pseudanabaenaceae cyanobacterium SKYG29]MDW8422095.1 GNAT family N-acetyltransferase [Pseudanabaenaceae cyanobacterium SKYGB_i_bin29]
MNQEQEKPPIITRRILQGDVEAVFRLIGALAEYEKLLPECTGTLEALTEHLFQEDAFIEAVVAEEENYPAGISTFYCRYEPLKTRPIFFVEDIFVEPIYRRRGVGRALMSYLAQLALGRSCSRMEWLVLDWNTLARNFYQNLQVVQILEHDRIARISGDALKYLAGQSLPPLVIREALPEDLHALWELFEARGGVTGSIDKLEEHLFGFIPYVKALIAENAGRPIGMALYSRTYSTFVTAPGVFLEELFVLPEYRGYGIGKSLLSTLAQRTLAMKGARLELYVDISQPKVVNYYQKLGAAILQEWLICRVDQPQIQKLAIN